MLVLNISQLTVQILDGLIVLGDDIVILLELVSVLLHDLVQIFLEDLDLESLLLDLILQFLVLGLDCLKLLLILPDLLLQF